MARFFRRGISKAAFLPAVSNLAAPSTAEITAGKDLSPQLADMSGFELENSPIAIEVLADRYTQQIPGEDTTSDSTMTFHDDDASEVLRTALAKGTTGFVLLQPYGNVATKRCEVWPATVTVLSDVWSTGNESAKFRVGFSITAVPETDAVLPT